MTRYHVNPETGRPNQCKAKIRCDFAVDGQEPPHFETKEEARKHVENVLTEEHGGPTRTVSKSSTKTGATNGTKLSKEELNDEISSLKDQERTLYQDLAQHTNGINDLELASEIAESVGIKEANEFLIEREYRVSGSADNKEEFYKNINDSMAEAKNKRNAARSSIMRVGAKRKQAENQASSNNKKNVSPKTKVDNTPTKLVLNDTYDYEEPKRISIEDGGYGGNAWVGSKVKDQKKYRPSKEIAKDIRQDIKEATSGGYLPEGFKYSVTVDSYSGGSSININIYGDQDIRDTHEYDPSFYGMRLKPEYKEFQDRVDKISDAYNYSDSNPQIDYFNRSFYGHAKINEGSQMAHKEHESNRRKFNKIIKERTDANGSSDLSQDKEFLAQEAQYYNSLGRYFEKVSYENAAHNLTRVLHRMPNDAEFDNLAKEAVKESIEKVELTKLRNEKQGRRFANRS